jgi:ABC-type branched-subunit amino acid transport system substrate-binding protein
MAFGAGGCGADLWSVGVKSRNGDHMIEQLEGISIVKNEMPFYTLPLQRISADLGDYMRLTFTVLVVVFALCSCSSAPVVDKRRPSPLEAQPGAVSDERGNQLLLKAHGFFGRGDYSQAQDLYQQYLIQFPAGRHADAALMGLGDTLALLEEHYEARMAYERLLESFPNSPLVPVAGVRIIAAYFHEGDLEAAQMLLNRQDITGLTPEEKSRFHLLAADINRTMALPIDAAKHYARAYETAPDDDKAVIRERFQEFIEYVSVAEMEAMAGQLDPVFPKDELLYRVASVLLQEGRYFDAGIYLDQFRIQFPEHEKYPWAGDKLLEISAQADYDRHTIGCLLPLTGPFQSYGTQALKGIELALHRYNADPGHPQISMAIRDTGGIPEKTFQAVDDLAAAKVAAIIGPMIAVEAAAFQAQEHGIPIITLTQKEAVHEIGEWVFRNFITPRMQVESVVSYASSDLGVGRFAILYPAEKYGTVYLSRFRDQVEFHGGVVTDAQPYDPGNTDFTESIKGLIHRYESNEPDAKPIVGFDALFVPDSPRKTSLIIPQLAFHDISDVVLLGTNLWGSEDFIRTNRQFLQGAVIPSGFFPHSQAPAVQDFITAFRAAHGQMPGFIEAISHDSTMMALDLMGREEIQSRVALKEGLLELSGYDGATGRTSFSMDGDARKELYLLRVQGDKLVEAAPSSMF